MKLHFTITLLFILSLTSCSSSDPNSSTEVDPNSNTEVDPNSDTEVDPNSDTEVDPNSDTEVDPNSDTEVDPNPGTEIDPPISIVGASLDYTVSPIENYLAFFSVDNLKGQLLGDVFLSNTAEGAFTVPDGECIVPSVSISDTTIAVGVNELTFEREEVPLSDSVLDNPTSILIRYASNTPFTYSADEASEVFESSFLTGEYYNSEIETASGQTCIYGSMSNIYIETLIIKYEDEARDYSLSVYVDGL